MSELTLFRDAPATIPAHLKGGPLDDLTKSLMGGASSNKRISIKGGIFRMVVDGEEIAKNEDRAMDIVIVNAAPKTSRTYYSGTYQEGENAAPACWSNDGDRPDAKVESPVSKSCATCPMNVAGSGQGTSRACRYNRRLAVLLANNVEQSDVYQLVLPAQSIFGKGENGKLPLEAYAKLLGNNGLTVSSVVTEMRFDTNSATPKLVFRAVRPLSMDELAVALEKGESGEAQQAVVFNPPPPKEKTAGAPAAIPAPKAPPSRASKPKEEVEEAEFTEVPEPKVRENKSAPQAPAPKDLDSVLDAWGDDD